MCWRVFIYIFNERDWLVSIIDLSVFYYFWLVFDFSLLTEDFLYMYPMEWEFCCFGFFPFSNSNLAFAYHFLCFYATKTKFKQNVIYYNFLVVFIVNPKKKIKNPKLFQFYRTDWSQQNKIKINILWLLGFIFISDFIWKI